MTKCRWLIAVACLVSACGRHDDISNNKMIQTTATVQAPMNLGGTVTMYQPGQEHERSGKRVVFNGPIIDETGTSHFEELKNRHGDFIVEAVGGHYTDPLTGRPISMRDKILHGYARGAEPYKDMQIVITPWTELQYRFMRRHANDAASVKAVEEALDKALGCGTHHFARGVPALPSEESPLITPGDAEMAYLQLGAWSQLAQSVSRQVGRGDDGVSVIGLVQALGDVIDRVGRIEGHIEVMPDQFIEADILRQRYAQAMRQFVENAPENVKLRMDPIRSFLECTSAAPADMWGPRGEKLDVDGPSIAVITPSADSIIVRDSEVRCEATDDSLVKSFALRLSQGGQDVTKKAAPRIFLTGVGTKKATIFAEINAKQLSRGALVIACVAEDKWSNKSTNGLITVHVNPAGGKTKVRVDAKETQKTQGRISITCECSDEYMQKCALITPSEAEGVTSAGNGTTSPSYVWDTTKVLDGNRVIICGNWSRGIAAPQEDYLAVVVDNTTPGQIQGTVYLDTPVQSATVEAYAYDEYSPDQPRGRSVSPASQTGTNGNFTLHMTDGYQGPVLIEVSSAGLGEAAHYQDLAANNEHVPFAGHKLTLLLADYQPGQSVNQLSINVATTLAEAYVTGQLLSGNSPDKLSALIDEGRSLIARHVKAEGLDITTTPVANFTKPINAQRTDAILMGLFHVGLSREALEITHRRKLPLGIFNILDLTDALRADLTNGVLDGLGSDEQGVALEGIRGAVLDPEALRWSLASAIHHWLNNDGVKTLGTGPNLTGLNHLDFVKDGQLLQLVSRNQSELFGGRPGQYFDQDGPVLHARILNAAGEEIDPKRWVRGIIYLHVQTRDVSGIESVNASINGEPLRAQDGGVLEDSVYPIDTAIFEGGHEGTVTIHVEATDRRKNKSNLPTPLKIHFDNASPTINVGIKPLWTQVQEVVIKGQLSKAISKGAIHLNGALLAIIPATSEDSATEFAVPVHLPSCNAKHHLQISVTGVAGNVGSKQMTVICKSTPPEIVMLTSPFKRAKSGEMDDTLVATTATSQGNNVQIEAANGAKQIEQLVTDLDESSPSAPPELRFVVSDKIQDSFGMYMPGVQAVSYEYRYMGQDGIAYVTKARPATYVKDRGYYSVRISYQSLLPDDILSAPIETARQKNFIGKCMKADRHTIVIRTVDAAGNESRMSYPFVLHLYSPPVTARCTAKPEIQHSTPHIWGLPPYWDGGPTPFVVKFYHSFDVDWDNPQNVVPKNGKVAFHIHDTMIRWAIYKIGMDSYINNISYQRAHFDSDVQVTPGDAARPTAIAELVADKGSAFLDYFQKDPYVLRVIGGGGLMTRRESEQTEYYLRDFQASLLQVPITMKEVSDGGHEPVGFHVDQSCDTGERGIYPMGFRIYWNETNSGHPSLFISGEPFYGPLPFDPW